MKPKVPPKPYHHGDVRENLQEAVERRRITVRQSAGRSASSARECACSG